MRQTHLSNLSVKRHDLVEAEGMDLIWLRVEDCTLVHMFTNDVYQYLRPIHKTLHRHSIYGEFSTAKKQYVDWTCLQN